MPTISNILIEPGTGTKIVAETTTNGTTANTATIDTTVSGSFQAHNHSITDVINLQATLDLKSNVSHSHVASDITDLDAKLTSKINSIVNLNGKANTVHTHVVQDIIGLSNVARTGSYSDLLNVPTFGSSANYNVPISGDAIASQVVLGADSRLTDARMARPHDHDLTIGDGASTRIMMKTTEQLHFVAGTNITLGFDDTANKITINSAGGATTDRLSTPRLLRIAGAVTGAVSFDGSADVTINTTMTGTHVHAIGDVTGLQTALDTKITATYFSTVGTSIAKALDEPSVRTILGLGTIATRADSEFTSASHIGSGGNSHSLATTTSHGFLSSTDKAKIDTLVSGATANSTDAQLRDRSTHTGTQSISTIAGLDTILASKSDSTHTHAIASTTTSGFLSVSDKNKLDSVTSGATANASDAQLRDRSTHTGTQPVSSITGLATVSTSGNYVDLVNKPAFGTSAYQNISTMGDATTSQVVLGNDSRLTDARSPLTHNHSVAIGDGSSPRISFGTNETLHIVSGANVSIVYDDIANKLTIATSGTITGTVDTAAKLATARSIALIGDVTGSVNFDGSNNVSMSTIIADDSHFHTISTVTGLQSILDSKAGNAIASTSTAGLMSATDKSKLDTLSNVTYPIVTSTSAGLMSATDKVKLDGVINYSTVTTTTSGIMLSTDKAKLDGIATGATANSTDTQLRDRSTHTGVQAISTITGLQPALDAKAALVHVHTTATTTADGFLASTDKVKLDSITMGATANSADAQLRDRSTHTGTQPVSSITGLQTTLDSKVATTQTLSYGDGTSARIAVALNERLDFVAGANIALAYDDATNKITISSSAQVSGSVGSADKLTIPRTIGISGAVTGSAVFDGSADIVITTALAAHNHNAATTTVAGFFAATDKVKLDGIATGATANSTDAQLRDRSTHTGVQAASTITGLASVATTGSYTDLINKPSVLKFTSATTEPVGAVDGDTWFNPNTGIKLTRISSTWAEI